jgi:hypothetical protein
MQEDVAFWIKSDKIKIKSKGVRCMKKVVSVLLIICLLGTLLCACGGKKITAQEAYEIVLEDLGPVADKAASPHIHEGTFEGKACFNIFINVDGMDIVYVISDTGKILHKGPGTGHSH